MGLRINTNVEGYNAHRSLSRTGNELSRSMERMASGFRINRAADDAAGLAISERMRSQIKGLEQAQRNTQDGISLVQTAEGGMQEVHSILQRVRELAVQFNNGTIDATGKMAITTEVAQLSAEVTRLIGSTDFNGINMLQSGSAVTLQVGPDSSQTMSVSRVDIATAIGTAISDFAGGTASISAIDTAISNVSTKRATLGAVQNRLEYASSSLGIATENVLSAESRIRDVDLAREATSFARLKIMQDSGLAMLANANMSKQSVLRLLE